MCALEVFAIMANSQATPVQLGQLTVCQGFKHLNSPDSTNVLGQA